MSHPHLKVQILLLLWELLSLSECPVFMLLCISYSGGAACIQDFIVP